METTGFVSKKQTRKILTCVSVNLFLFNHRQKAKGALFSRVFGETETILRNYRLLKLKMSIYLSYGT